MGVVFRNLFKKNRSAPLLSNFRAPQIAFAIRAAAMGFSPTCSCNLPSLVSIRKRTQVSVSDLHGSESFMARTCDNVVLLLLGQADELNCIA